MGGREGGYWAGLAEFTGMILALNGCSVGGRGIPVSASAKESGLHHPSPTGEQKWTSPKPQVIAHGTLGGGGRVGMGGCRKQGEHGNII